MKTLIGVQIHRYVSSMKYSFYKQLSLKGLPNQVNATRIAVQIFLLKMKLRLVDLLEQICIC